MPLLVLLFIVVPLAEIFVIIQVGGLIGALPTIAILFADSVLGAALLASQGRAAWARFQLALGQGRVPHDEILDGALVLVGGTLLLTPGFITDGVGFLLLIPPSRSVVRRTIRGFIARRLRSGRRVVAWGYGGARAAAGRASGYDVEGEAHEVGSEPHHDDRADDNGPEALER